MLKILHGHIFASKLRDVFTTSPLVLVYQTVGSADVSRIGAQLQSQVDAQLPGSGLHVQMCHMRNSVAAGTGDPALAQLFQASNLLVGFALPPTPPAPVTQRPEQQQDTASGSSSSSSSSTISPSSGGGSGARASRQNSLQDLLAHLFAPQGPTAASGQLQPQQQQQFPHKVLAKAFQLGSALPGEHPLLLLGAFYGRKSIRLGHLSEWVKLDERAVYSDLLGAIESPLHGLALLEMPAERLASTLDAAAPHDLLYCLDARAADAGAGAADAGAGA